MAMEFEVLCDAVAAEDPGNNGRPAKIVYLPDGTPKTVGGLRGMQNQYGDVLVIRPKGAVWGSMETLFHQPVDWPFEEPEIEALFLSLPESHRTLSYPFQVKETLEPEEIPDDLTGAELAEWISDTPVLKRSSKRVAFENMPSPIQEKVKGNLERVPKIAKQMIAAHVKDR